MKGITCVLTLVCCMLGTVMCAEDALDSTIEMHLHSHDWRLRRIGFNEIRNDHSLQTQMHLGALLDTENAATKEAYMAGSGVEDKYGEEYVNYKDELSSASPTITNDSTTKTHFLSCCTPLSIPIQHS